MSLHATSPNVVRLPARLRVISSDGIAIEKPCAGNGVGAISRPKPAGGFALDALLSAGTIDARQHAAGLAYAAFHRRFDAVGRTSKPGRTAALPEPAWNALKTRRAALVAAAGFDRFLLDRLCLEDEAPIRSEVERVREALERVAGLT